MLTLNKIGNTSSIFGDQWLCSGGRYLREAHPAQDLHGRSPVPVGAVWIWCLFWTGGTGEGDEISKAWNTWDIGYQIISTIRWLRFRRQNNTSFVDYRCNIAQTWWKMESLPGIYHKADSHYSHNSHTWSCFLPLTFSILNISHEGTVPKGTCEHSAKYGQYSLVILHSSGTWPIVDLLFFQACFYRHVSLPIRLSQICLLLVMIVRIPIVLHFPPFSNHILPIFSSNYWFPRFFPIYFPIYSPYFHNICHFPIFSHIFPIFSSYLPWLSQPVRADQISGLSCCRYAMPSGELSLGRASAGTNLVLPSGKRT